GAPARTLRDFPTQLSNSKFQCVYFDATHGVREQDQTGCLALLQVATGSRRNYDGNWSPIAMTHHTARLRRVADQFHFNRGLAAEGVYDLRRQLAVIEVDQG